MRQIAAAWSVRHPQLQARLFRAVHIAAAGEVKSQGEGVFVVKGQYIVTVDHESGTSACTCKDHQRGNHCKHRLATAILFVYEAEVAAQKAKKA